MFLAPINYDRFFERVFKHTHIAKRFLEDLLNVKIEEIELLPRKNKLTDDAAFVEFDFRCKIDGQYSIIDMQQWYKNDVVKRFYMYFCNNTSLQLEDLKTVIIPPVIKKAFEYQKGFKTKNYDDVKPAITIIWMANDTLGFTDDIVAFSILPEILVDFVKDEKLWTNLSLEDILEFRGKVLSILNNNTKNLGFLSKNRMIYAFQSSIVKNHKAFKNVILDKLVRWFEFAEKTLNKNNTEKDFLSFKKDPIFMEVIELLKTTEMESDDMQYIADYEDFDKDRALFIEKLTRDLRQDIREQLLQEVKQEVRQEVKQEVRQEVKQEVKQELEVDVRKELQKKQEELQVEIREELQEKIRKELENEFQLVEEANILKNLKKLLGKGLSLAEIADFMEIDLEMLNAYFKKLP